MKSKPPYKKIVLTGGPGGGKSTAADLFMRELDQKIVVVPEAASLVYSGGFPRSPNLEATKAAQRAIYHVQKNLEDVWEILNPYPTLLCDRGTVDGAAYWPTDGLDFFSDVGTTFQNELDRYDAVLFFETAAKGGHLIESGNSVRNESLIEAIELDSKLQKIWGHHPHFILIKNENSFFEKLTKAISLLKSLTMA